LLRKQALFREGVMSNFAKNIETVANVSIVITALLIGVVVLRRGDAIGDTRPRQVSVIGKRLSIQEVEWKKGQKTVVLALSKGCHYCSESAGFYRRLTTEVNRRNGLKVVAVLPQSLPEASQYLRDLAVDVPTIRQSPLESLHVAGTPTLMFVDEHGAVTRAWVGKLSPDQEAEVIRLL